MKDKDANDIVEDQNVTKKPTGEASSKKQDENHQFRKFACRFRLGEIFRTDIGLKNMVEDVLDGSATSTCHFGSCRLLALAFGTRLTNVSLFFSLLLMILKYHAAKETPSSQRNIVLISGFVLTMRKPNPKGVFGSLFSSIVATLLGDCESDMAIGPYGELDGVVSPLDELDTPKLMKLVKMGH
ncbi:hypothetical protein Tco_0775134 [Tanacetum coccineum]